MADCDQKSEREWQEAAARFIAAYDAYMGVSSTAPYCEAEERE
jgi:hypothetical protein